MKKIGFIVAAAIFLTTCGNQVVPLTGRKQFNIVSNTEIFPLSFDQYKQVLVKNKVETKTARALQLKRVGARIQAAVERYFAQQGQRDLLYGYKWEQDPCNRMHTKILLLRLNKPIIYFFLLHTIA